LMDHAAIVRRLSGTGIGEARSERPAGGLVFSYLSATLRSVSKREKHQAHSAPSGTHQAQHRHRHRTTFTSHSLQSHISHLAHISHSSHRTETPRPVRDRLCRIQTDTIVS
jgi:hypothetical protein